MPRITSFRLGGGAFTEKLCDACAAKLVGTPSVVTFTGHHQDKLMTGAHFVVNRFGTTPCEFQVSSTTQSTAGTIVVESNHGCADFDVTAGTGYTIHGQKHTPCLTTDTSASVLETELNKILGGTNAPAVSVTREDPSTARKWWVTFIGATVSGDQPPLVLMAVDSDGTEGSTGKNGGCKAFAVQSNVQATVASIQRPKFTPGTKYYIRVRIKNKAGIGEATEAKEGGTTAGLTPRSPPGLPTDVRVFAVKDDNTKLKVQWMPVDSDNGAPITKYIVEYKKTAQTATRHIGSKCCRRVVVGHQALWVGDDAQWQHVDSECRLGD